MIKIQDVYHSFLDINREDVCEDNEIMMLTSFLVMITRRKDAKDMRGKCGDTIVQQEF